jgi:hypothetical protein
MMEDDLWYNELRTTKKDIPILLEKGVIKYKQIFRSKKINGIYISFASDMILVIISCLPPVITHQ